MVLWDERLENQRESYTESFILELFDEELHDNLDNPSYQVQGGGCKNRRRVIQIPHLFDLTFLYGKPDIRMLPYTCIF